MRRLLPLVVLLALAPPAAAAETVITARIREHAGGGPRALDRFAKGFQRRWKSVAICRRAYPIAGCGRTIG